MKVLLKIIPNPGAPATATLLDVPTVRIGRGADQDLLLTDLRVALAHAEITARKALLGPVYRIDTKARLGLWVNGRPATSAELAVGDVIDLGRHRLTVSKPSPGVDLVLGIEDRHAPHEERSTRRRALKLTLQETGWSRRRWAWLLFLLVLVPGLLLPIWMAHNATRTDRPVSRDHQPQYQPGFDIVWNSGPLSSAHHVLQNDCSACHQKPFVPANDSSCRGCHAPLHEHAASVKVLQQSPFDAQQCTDCHREHNGLTGLVPRGNQACTSCHANPAHLPGRTLQAVKDFSQSHPVFSLSLARMQGDGFVWQEIAQNSPEAKRQDTGLKFPHDVHLDAKGIDSRDGIQKLECSDCHKPNADRSGFLPVTMQQHCASCHSLDFDAADPSHELPHGKPEQVVRIVRDYYAAIALAGRAPPQPVGTTSGPRRRPDAAPSTLPAVGRTPAWASAKADIALRDVFERRTCFYCHTVTRDGPAENPWRIAPVAAQQTALNGAVFPHSAHSTETCTSCHAAKTSKHSEDVLVPDIGRCRDCHGDTGSMKETPSTCQSCHGYHTHALDVAASPVAVAPP